MVELPDEIVPNEVRFTAVDLGFVQEGAGGLGDRIDRPGNHFAAEIDFPPMKPARARVFAARMTRALREGLRIEIPLLDVDQGIPGAPVVDGADQAGTALVLRGLSAGYAVKEGFWATLVEALTEQRYTHLVQANAVADEAGALTLTIEPPLRAPFADGDAVLLARPTIEGAVRAAPSWLLSVDKLVRNGATVTVEEVA